MRLTNLGFHPLKRCASGNCTANAALKANKHLFHIKVNITSSTEIFVALLWSCALAGPGEEAAAAFFFNVHLLSNEVMEAERSAARL